MTAAVAAVAAVAAAARLGRTACPCWLPTLARRGVGRVLPTLLLPPPVGPPALRVDDVTADGAGVDGTAAGRVFARLSAGRAVALTAAGVGFDAATAAAAAAALARPVGAAGLLAPSLGRTPGDPRCAGRAGAGPGGWVPPTAPR